MRIRRRNVSHSPMYASFSGTMKHIFMPFLYDLSRYSSAPIVRRRFAGINANCVIGMRHGEARFALLFESSAVVIGANGKMFCSSHWGYPRH